jgi:hypothetical protein
MALIDVTLNNTMNYVMPFRGLMEEVYKTDNILADFLWSFTMFSFSASLGWLITMIYYKSDKVMKILVSLCPVVLLLLLTIINQYTNGIIFTTIGKMIMSIFSISPLDPLVAARNIILLTFFVFAVCYPLNASTTIKD